MVEINKDIRVIQDLLAGLPKADKLLLSKDLRKYPDGVPEEDVFEPSSWCGKKRILLSKGEEGLMEFFDYITSTKSGEVLKRIAIAAGLSIAAVLIAILVNRVISTIEANRLAQEVISSGQINNVVDEKEAVKQLSKFIQEKTKHPYAGVIDADALNRSFETSGLMS